MSLETVLAPLKGLGVTLRTMLAEPKVTVQFPEERLNLSPRYRGMHELRLYEDGSEVCVGCSLCAAACPADCIFVEGAEEADEGRERYARQYMINYSRCIFCGYCVEACPVDAIGMTKVMQDLTMTNRWSAVWDKDALVGNFQRRIAEEKGEAPAKKDTKLVSQSNLLSINRGL
jgi:NADH-quinone oxidoreductase subunit I